MKTFAQALAIVLLGLPLVSGAAGTKIATSSMQVTFTITESCNVQSAGNAAAASAQRTAAPAVSCQLNTPYQVKSGADKAVAPAANGNGTGNGAAIRTETAPQDWTIYF
jgi:hypothetical protein